jgi:glycosyltransferase involved in cell wall biosynthesis
MQKKRILIFIDWFEPAYKAGGPIRSIVNLVHSLEGSYDIFVFTSNKDLGDAVPMLGVQSNQWVNYSKTAKVFYAGANRLGPRFIWKEIRKVQPDYIYCNSLFSFWFSIYPILLKRLGLIKFPVILAPKGMLRASALKFKSTKKKIFLQLFSLLGIPKIIDFHATDLEEATSIENSFGKVSIYPILDSPAALPRQISRIEKKQGSLRILFVGRIHPIKQLDVVLNCLQEQTAQIVLTVVGVIEDDLYWKKCRTIIENLPQNVEVKIISAVQHFELAAIINDHHILFLPTLGENFGHAIYEALGAGRPVLISDQTIWRNLSIAEAGWDISLHDKNRFSLILKEIVNWNQDTFAVWSKGARKFVEEYLIKNEPLSAYKKLFK